MNLSDVIVQLQFRLNEINSQQEANERSQEINSRRIKELESELEEEYLRQSELDREAIDLYRKAEEIQTKLDKLERIASLSRQFQELREECKNNEDLLDTLYESFIFELQGRLAKESEIIKEEDSENLELTIDTIKAALPNAEEIYHKLVSKYYEDYQVYDGYLVDKLNLIWYSVAFVAFGRTLYRKVSRKHHPDLQGSENAMQLINCAWEISQDYLGSLTG